MKKLDTQAILIVIGAVFTTAAIFYLATWYFPSQPTTQNGINCEYLREYAAHLDVLSYEIDAMEEAIKEKTATNPEQLRAWREYLPELVEEYNGKAQDYNTQQKKYNCRDAPAEYFPH